jgi:hypothetical protein
MIIIPKLYSDSFDWSRWRNGIAIWREIGVQCRTSDIIDKKKVLHKYAVGYLSGKSLYCRSKDDEIAVMFIIDNEFCWTHFRLKEFENVFIE